MNSKTPFVDKVSAFLVAFAVAFLIWQLFL